MCGFVGLVTTQEAAPALHLALQSIQHRGQDAAGLGTRHAGRFFLHKDLGMVSQVLGAGQVAGLRGRAGIAHVRYPTAGASSSAQDAQPFITRRPGILLAHNGNVTNVQELDGELSRAGLHILSQCDAEPILLVLADELTRRRPSGHTAEDVVAAVRALFARVRGAYSVVAVLEVDGQETLLAFRDPHGIRPGCYGTDDRGAWMATSESVALDVLDFRLVGDIPAGEVLLLRAGQPPVRLPVQPARPRPCAFERVYFARPDSRLEDGRVNRTRWRLGRRLAQEWAKKGLQADVIVAVPDTSRPAAQAMAEELGLRHREGFIKNRYSGRTFIMPDARTRDAALRLKLNPIAEVFEGQRVILVDDSIVRGTTMRRILAMVRGLKPAEVHLAIFSPAVRHPCYYGVDMPSSAELVAASLPEAEAEQLLARQLGADSLTWLSLAGLREVLGQDLCDACFSGDYAVPLREDEKSAILAERRGG